MAKRTPSRHRDNASQTSRLSDTALGVPEVLREARHRKQLSQQELARKLGLRQRQISDLERAATDSRLSKLQTVARALDLELMLIPRQLLSAVEGMLRGTTGDDRPLYAMNELDPDEPDEAKVVRRGRRSP